MPRSAGWTFAVLSSSRGVNNFAIAPYVTDAGHASRASGIKRAADLNEHPTNMGYKPRARHSGGHLAGTLPAHFIS
jgi:hypothetical protein